MKLNLKNIRLFLRMAYSMVFAILITCFFATVFCKETIALPELLFILGAFVLSYFIREITYYNILVFIVHVLMAGSSFLMPSALSVRVLLCLVCVYLYGSSMNYAKSGGVLKKTDDLPGPAFLLGFLVYFYGWYMNDDSMKDIAYIMQVLVIFLYLANMYVDGITKYVESSKELKGLPLRNIISVNTIIVLIIAVIMFTALRLADIPDFSGTMRRIGQAVVSAVRYIFMIVVLLFRWIAFLFFRNNMDEDGSALNQYGTQENEGLLTDIIEMMVRISIAVIAIYILIKAVKKLVEFLKYIISKRNYSGDTVEVITIDKKKKNVKSTGIIKRITRKLSNEERARRIYRNKIMDYGSYVNLEENMTAINIKDEIEKNTGDDLTEITDLYEKVRYSGEAVTGSDVKSINILARRINRGSKEEG